MVKWEYLTDAFVTKPDWHTGDIWAVQITRNRTDGKYALYYAFPNKDHNDGVGVAVADHPYGPFEDRGIVLDSFGMKTRNSIDEFYFETGQGTDRKAYMFWGSFQGIFGSEVDIHDKRTLIGEPFQIAGGGFEASYVIEKDGKFWYFGSTGRCCSGPLSTYYVSVARADNPRGPYMTKNGESIRWIYPGEVILNGTADQGWVGPGHNGEIFMDDNQRWFMIYHAVAVENAYLPKPWGFTRRPLMMDEIIWGADGWPYIEGGHPSVTSQTAPFFLP
jgi:arabinan endo-1,5-alpha-L-arabinosidase